MPYDGSGNFTIINNFEEDRINGVSIDSLKMDNNFDDIANGLSNVMLRSGSVVMTGILNMGDHKITNLVAGTSSKDAVNKSQMDTALSAKQATITGGASTITSSNLTANRALISSSSGKVAVSAVTATELGYISGVTSAIQTQINTKAVNNEVVHKAGGETITGTKTFEVNGASADAFVIKNKAIDLGTVPSNNIYTRIYLKDKNGNNMACLYSNVSNNGNNSLMLQATKNDGNNDLTTMGLVYPSSGNPYALAPTPDSTTSTSGYQIATTGWVNSLGNNVVHLTGNETINDVKTFFGEITRANKNITKGTTPSSGINTVIAFTDKNDKTLGDVYHRYEANKDSRTILQATKANASGDTDTASISIRYPASGNPYGEAPASDVNGSIVTTVNKSKSQNGYFKLGNGLIVQWGRATASNVALTITLPTAFSSATSYSISAITNNGKAAFTQTQTSTTFHLDASGGIGSTSLQWIAIGY